MWNSSGGGGGGEGKFFRASKSNLPRGVAELTPLRGEFGHHDLISLNEDYPLSYKDTCCGLPGLVPPYCALLKYIGFIDLDLIVFRKLYIF